MKKLIFINVFILFLSSYTFADFILIKEKQYNIYYEKSINFYSLEYVIKLLKDIDRDFNMIFFQTNRKNIDIYLYNDIVKFMSEQNTMWWQNYLIKSNQIAINNIDLLLQKNSMYSILKYLIFNHKLNNFYKDKFPKWFLNGLSIYFADKDLFKKGGLKFINISEVKNKLKNYVIKDEFETANCYCMLGIKYLVNNHTKEKLIEYIGVVNSGREFKKGFFDFFGISFVDYLNQFLKF